MGLIYIRPDADTTDGSWKNASGNNTNLYDSVDESVASDSDYIRSSDNPVNDIVKLRLSNFSSAPTEPMTVRYRFRKVVVASEILSLQVRLVEGNAPGDTIAEWKHSDISAAYVDGEQLLTTEQFDAIGDFNDLYLEFEAITGLIATYDLVADFGGDGQAWLEFFAEAPRVEGGYTLTIPAGSYTMPAWGIGNTQCTIIGAGTGSTIIDLGGNGTYAITPQGAPAEPDYPGPHPRIEDAVAGQTTVTLKTLGDVSRFTVGFWVLIGSLEMQGTGGFPMNLHYFEWRKVTGINVGTGVITLDEGLHFDYPDDYPDFPSTGAFIPDCGGPGIIVPVIQHGDSDSALNFPSDIQGWNCEVLVKDLTVDSAVYFGASRSVTYQNVHFADYPPACSQAQLFRFIDCEFNGQDQENDKLVEWIDYQNCTFNANSLNQSSSNILLTATDCTGTGFGLNGVARTTVITNCDMLVNVPTTTSYGNTVSFTTEDSNVQSWGQMTNRSFPISLIDDLTAGVITIDKSSYAGSDAMLDLIPGCAAFVSEVNEF